MVKQGRMEPNRFKQGQTAPKGPKRVHILSIIPSLIQNPLSSILYTISIIPNSLYLILCASYTNLHSSLLPPPLTLTPSAFLISLILYPSSLISYPLSSIPYPLSRYHNVVNMLYLLSSILYTLSLILRS